MHVPDTNFSDSNGALRSLEVVSDCSYFFYLDPKIRTVSTLGKICRFSAHTYTDHNRFHDKFLWIIIPTEHEYSAMV